MSNINIWEKYKQICKIGYGAYGKVYKVQNIETGVYFAMKEIEKEKFEGREDKLLNLDMGHMVKFIKFKILKQENILQ